MKKLYSFLTKLLAKLMAKHFDGSKKDIAKFLIQTVINILAAVLTALGATSCIC